MTDDVGQLLREIWQHAPADPTQPRNKRPPVELSYYGPGPDGGWSVKFLRQVRQSRRYWGQSHSDTLRGALIGARQQQQEEPR